MSSAAAPTGASYEVALAWPYEPVAEFVSAIQADGYARWLSRVLRADVGVWRGEDKQVGYDSGRCYYSRELAAAAAGCIGWAE